MLSGKLQPDSLASGFAWYNAIAAAAGSLGALAAALPTAVGRLWSEAPAASLWLLMSTGVALVGIPLAAGVVLSLGGGIPFLVAGALKSVYDLTLSGWFRTIPLHQQEAVT